MEGAEHPEYKLGELQYWTRDIKLSDYTASCGTALKMATAPGLLLAPAREAVSDDATA